MPGRKGLPLILHAEQWQKERGSKDEERKAKN
jgi:hypothetical protein